MRRVIGFCNLHNSPSLGELTKNRTLASTSFLGRFAFIDFTLSNFSNSGIDEIGILCQDHVRSLTKHLGFQNSWNINTKIGSNIVMYNEEKFNNPRYNNDLNNIRTNDWFLIKSNAEFVVIAPVHFLCTIDYSKVIDEHIKSGADVTVVYKRIDYAKEAAIGVKALEVDDDKKVINIYENRGANNVANISLESYVMTKDYLRKILKESLEISSVFSLTDYLSHCINSINLKGYEYTGFVRCVDSLEKYLDVSLEMFSYDKRKELFKEGWPIYTVTHDTPPTRYGSNAKVSNSIVANGAIIDGTVENSIISRSVVVSSGAKVTNSIILTETYISNDTVLDYCIVDKYSRILCVKELKGKKNNPLYVKQGDII